eukprot:29936-Hanusia_phi.AAC.1
MARLIISHRIARRRDRPMIRSGPGPGPRHSDSDCPLRGPGVRSDRAPGVSPARAGLPQCGRKG